MMHQLYTAATIGNIILLVILIYLFWQSYRNVKSEFALGLVIFAVILLIDAILSCPIFYPALGSTGPCPVNIFHATAAVFEFMALVVLLYLVRK
ncbi:MAG: hypothetical protein ACE5J5_02865 [Candidatus Hydrothermarchaeales archaeon]